MTRAPALWTVALAAAMSTAACSEDTGAGVVVSVSEVPAGVTALDVAITVDDLETQRVFDSADARAAFADGEATFAIAIADDRDGLVTVNVRAMADDCAVAEGAGACAVGPCDQLDVALAALTEPDCAGPGGPDAGLPDGGLDDGRD